MVRTGWVFALMVEGLAAGVAPASARGSPLGLLRRHPVPGGGRARLRARQPKNPTRAGHQQGGGGSGPQGGHGDGDGQ